MKLKKLALLTASILCMGASAVWANSFQVVDAKIGTNVAGPEVISKTTLLHTPKSPTEVVLKPQALTLSRQGQDQWIALNNNPTRAGVMAFINDEEPNKVFYLVDLKQKQANKKKPVKTQTVYGFDDTTNTWKTYLTNDQVPGETGRFDYKVIRGVKDGMLVAIHGHAQHTGKEVTLTNDVYDMTWDKDKQAFGYKKIETKSVTVPQDKVHQQGLR
ncbi:MAG: hypothetical protein HUJ84_00520 [Veillonella sp.]|nr:hypothetical protein [Veillonella sp.]MCF0156694.1 hypothetical protein [Veillonella sp.]